MIVRLVALALVAWWPGFALAIGESDDPITSCTARVEAEPEAYDAFLCFLMTGRDPAYREPARDRLEEIRRQRPASGWPLLTLGQLAMVDGDFPRAREHFAGALGRFSASGEALGEILSRFNRHNIDTRQGRFVEAAADLEAVRRVAAGSSNPEARARAQVLEGIHQLRTGGDLVRALVSFNRAAGIGFPDGSFGLKRTTLFYLAQVAFDLGRLDEAQAAYARLATLLRAEGGVADLATVAFNRANVRQAQLEREPEEGGLEGLRGMVEEALEQAEATGDRTIAARCHALLAQIHAASDATRARRHVAACLGLAKAMASSRLTMICLWSRADLETRHEPAAALATTTEALSLADQIDSDSHRAYSWRSRMRGAWAALPEDQALTEGQKALAAIEALRDGQSDAGDKARILDNWTADYSWLAGRVLASGGDPATAFAIFERLRGRVLREILHGDAVEVDSEPLRQLKRRGVELQRRLLDPALPEGERQRALAVLESVELEERVLRATSKAPLAVEATAETRGDVKVLPAVSLARLQAGLRPREALLTFQVDHRRHLFGAPAGDSWVLAITAEDVRVLRLPERRRLAAATSILRGLVARRDGSEVAAAGQLGRQLLGDVLAGLPASVERLILVPDGVLHHLPFAVLRPSGDGPPLGTSHELVVVPSATLWLEWRRGSSDLTASRSSTEPRSSALVMADPTFLHSRGGSAERGGAWVEGLRLGRLREARREGRSIHRHLGGELLLGSAASEHRLKSENLPRWSVLHFATHAIADLRRPERSCLLLAPGSDDEDGLLRASEVADLDLEGNLVVLSACHTSHGEVLRSEGLMSLARAFFAAGAGSVVGSHWPLADADAADFFDSFYRRLAAGDSAAAALRWTRRRGYEAGDPAQAWAGPVLLGSGEPRVTVESRSAVSVARAFGLAGVVLLLVVAVASSTMLRGSSVIEPPMAGREQSRGKP